MLYISNLKKAIRESSEDLVRFNKDIFIESFPDSPECNLRDYARIGYFDKYYDELLNIFTSYELTLIKDNAPVKVVGSRIPDN
jgi:hypothetical protein